MKIRSNCNGRSKSARVWTRSLVAGVVLAFAGIVYAAYTNSEVLVTTTNTDGASISANGARIAYRQDTGSGASAIKVRYGGSTYDLTTGYLHHVGRPRISRDGLYVAFYGATSSGSALKPYGCKIGNAPVQLGNFSGGDQPPAVSDDLGNGTARYCFKDAHNVPSQIPLGPMQTSSLVVCDAGTSAGSQVAITWLSGSLVTGVDPAITADGSEVFFTRTDASPNQIRVSDVGSPYWAVTSEIVSTGGSGAGNGDSRDSSCSSNGNYVAFASNSSNLGGSDSGGNYDVFVRDRSGATLTRAYTGNTQSMAIGGYDADAIEMAADGDFVTFHSGSDDILNLNFCSLMQNYVHTTVYLSEWSTQTTEAVAFQPDGNGDPVCLMNGTYPSISEDADHIGFQSDTPGIVSGDNDGYLNVLHKYTHI